MRTCPLTYISKAEMINGTVRLEKLQYDMGNLKGNEQAPTRLCGARGYCQLLSHPDLPNVNLPFTISWSKSKTGPSI